MISRHAIQAPTPAPDQAERRGICRPSLTSSPIGAWPIPLLSAACEPKNSESHLTRIIDVPGLFIDSVRVSRERGASLEASSSSEAKEANAAALATAQVNDADNYRTDSTPTHCTTPQIELESLREQLDQTNKSLNEAREEAAIANAKSQGTKVRLEQATLSLTEAETISKQRKASLTQPQL